MIVVLTGIAFETDAPDSAVAPGFAGSSAYPSSDTRRPSMRMATSLTLSPSSRTTSIAMVVSSVASPPSSGHDCGSIPGRSGGGAGKRIALERPGPLRSRLPGSLRRHRSQRDQDDHGDHDHGQGQYEEGSHTVGNATAMPRASGGTRVVSRPETEPCAARSETSRYRSGTWEWRAALAGSARDQRQAERPRSARVTLASACELASSLRPRSWRCAHPRSHGFITRTVARFWARDGGRAGPPAARGEEERRRTARQGQRRAQPTKRTGSSHPGEASRSARNAAVAENPTARNSAKERDIGRLTRPCSGGPYANAGPGMGRGGVARPCP